MAHTRNSHTVAEVVGQGTHAWEVADFGPLSSFVHRTSERTLHTTGVHRAIPAEADPRGIPAYARDLLDRVRSENVDGGDVPLLVGALLFHSDRAGELFVPHVARFFPSRDVAVPKPSSARVWQHQSVPEPATYEYAVHRVLAQLNSGQLDKVVLARSVRLTAPEPIDISHLLHRLAYRDPRAHTFAVRLPGDASEEGRRRMLIGASPELLVSTRGSAVVSHPLAGSAERSADPVQDLQRGQALQRSAKDAREHAIVVEAIAEILKPYCRWLTVPPRPALLRTASMWHLGRRISGELADPATSSLELAIALHPTPAVCGWPTVRARQVIDETEPFERDFCSGAVGWCDLNGDGDWVVALRCAEISGETARLFAGAGIVPGSDPKAELAETSAKLRTLLSALELEAEV